MRCKENDASYMQKACEAEALASCKKKKLGVCLVLTDGTFLQASNGPPFPLADCGACPREFSESGTDLHLCRAVHAERRALLTAAKLGLSTEGSTMYSHMGVPCKDCLLEMIACGVKELVCIRKTYYDGLAKKILAEWQKNGGVFRIYKPDCKYRVIMGTKKKVVVCKNPDIESRKGCDAKSTSDDCCLCLRSSGKCLMPVK